jgi:hypothetical protein
MKTEVKVSELKSNYWREVSNKKIQPQIEYDPENDVFYFYFVPSGKDPIVTHYVDQNVAFVFRASDNEIVGFCIEGFERSFSSRYANKHEWKLSETGVVIQGIRELKFAIKREQNTRVDLPVTDIRVNRDIDLQPEYAFA